MAFFPQAALRSFSRRAIRVQRNKTQITGCFRNMLSVPVLDMSLRRSSYRHGCRLEAGLRTLAARLHGARARTRQASRTLTEKRRVTTASVYSRCVSRNAASGCTETSATYTVCSVPFGRSSKAECLLETWHKWPCRGSAGALAPE